MSAISHNRYRYAGFIHFKNLHDVPALVKMLEENSRRYCAWLEHMDHINPTDKHIQWAIERDEPWDTALTNLLGVKGRYGKMLVESKTANNGKKSAKRWGKIDAVKAGYSWKSCMEYVYKAYSSYKPPSELDSVVWCNDEEWKQCLDKPVRRKRSADDGLGGPDKKQKPYYVQLQELWVASGKPETKEAIFEMLIDNAMLNKWQYCSRTMIYRAAEYLLMAKKDPQIKDDYMRWFRNKQMGVDEDTFED